MASLLPDVVNRFERSACNRSTREEPLATATKPQVAGQPCWAARVNGLGIGAAHDGPTPTTESLSAALGTAVTPETGARATGVAGTIRTDGATVAAKLLLDADSRGR